jgi:hypothetical protein
MRRMRIQALLAAGAIVALSVSPVDPAHPAGAATVNRAVTVQKVVSRTNLNADGSQQLVDSRNVSVTVSDTSQLQGRQDVDVSWTGAHPTGGIQPDYNSTAASSQEYPVAVLECRGQDTTSGPVAQRANPTTCWTHGSTARFQSVSYTAFGPWRMDRYASTADRAAVVGRPSDPPTACGDPTASERWVPFVSASGPSYEYGNNGCAGLPPEDFEFDSSSQSVPQNATFAATTADGTGSIKFDMDTVAENASLGCSATVPCTLEVIPIMGISCDPYGVSPVAGPLPADDIPAPGDEAKLATQLCEAGPSYAPGALANVSQSVSAAVSGSLWWSASNWNNRISFPLSFAPVSNACNVVSSGPQVDVYGS